MSDAAIARAGTARAYLAARRRRRRPSLFAVYLALVAALVTGVLGEHVLAAIVGGGLSAQTAATVGPAALALVLVAALRFGVWQGPVSFSVADVCLLLVAPVSTAALVRPKLDHALVTAALAGALLATAAVLLSAGGVDAVGAPRAVATVAGVGAFGAMSAAAGWLVQASPVAARRIARAGSWSLLAGLALLVAAATHGVQVAVGWSGPWGWALAPLADRAAWPAATALVIAAALAVCVLALRRAGTARPEGFLERARVRSGIATAAFTLDYRGAALARRGAASAPAGPDRPVRATRRRLPRPRNPRAVIPWRDAVTLRRAPARAGWAAVVGAAGVVEAATHPGRGLPAVAAAIVLYGAAAVLCEPLRAEVDSPDRGRVLLSRPFRALLVGHCAVPAGVLVAAGAATLAGLVVAGQLGATALALIPSLLLAGVAVAVLGAALATRRGGRIGPELLGRLLALDPSSPMVLLAVVWLAPWLLVVVAVLSVAVALLGAAAGGPHAVLAAGVGTTALVAAVAAVLYGVARRSPPPEP